MSFGAYASNRSDWNFQKWLVPALLSSLLLHSGLLVYFQQKRLHTFAPVQTERLIPRAFDMKRAEVDPRILQSNDLPKPEARITKPNPDATKLNSPSPKKAFETALDEIRVAPAMPDLTKPLVEEKPQVDPASVNSALSQMEQRSTAALERELDTVRKELTAQKPASINQPSLIAQGLTDSASDPITPASDIAARLTGSSAGPEVGEPGGFSDVDQLLNQTGPLRSGTAPILMPADLLFDYDSFNLRAGALSSMSNLGKLILKNPTATFTIEGYSDSFGSPTYNVQLSQKRADAVKAWLVQTMAIDPSRIQTRGFGSTKLLVPASAGVEQQQLNRRVEIAIRTK